MEKKTIQERAHEYAEKAYRSPKPGSIAGNGYIAGATEQQEICTQETAPLQERIDELEGALRASEESLAIAERVCRTDAMKFRLNNTINLIKQALKPQQ